MNLAMVVVVNLFIGLQPGIDNWGHLGGLIGGAAFAWFAGPVLGVESSLGGYNLVDKRTQKDVVLGGLLAALPFVILVAIRFLMNFGI